MSRVKTGVVRRKKHKKVLKEAKGYRGASGDVFKQAKQATMRAAAYSTRDTQQRKRKMRELWIIRINAAARLNGLTYSKFMNGLKKAGIVLDRKVLADLAVNNAAEFASLAEVAKQACN
jgi:large subunit ribosomal protein L20